MTAARERWILVGLAVLGVVLRLPWVLVSPEPWDWDAMYYQLVAEQIAAGHGAVSPVLPTLGVIPSSLPGPADLHWMPLPSRVLVPGTWLAGAWGAALTPVLLGAALGPLAYRLAREGLDASVRLAVVAGGVGAAGGLWMRHLATTDSYALTAVLGGVAFLAAARQRWVWAAAAAFALAWTRSDGFLVGLALALAFPGWRAVAVGAAGLVAQGLWTLRNVAVVGSGWLEARAQVGAAQTYAEVYDGVLHHDPGLVDRLLRALEAVPAALLPYWGLATFGVFAPVLVWGAWRHRGRRWVIAAAAAFGVVPVLTTVLAPVVAEHGTLYRTGSALVVPLAVVLLAGLDALAAVAHDRRGYPRTGSLVFLAVAFAAAGGLAGGMLLGLQPGPVDCSRLDGLDPRAPILSDRPMEVAWHCRHPAVMMTGSLPPDRAAAVIRAYGIRHALVHGEQGSGRVDADEAARILPGWEARGSGLWVAPGQAE